MTNPPPPGDPNQWGAPPPPHHPNQWAPPQPPVPTPPNQQYVWLYVVFGVVVALLVAGGVWVGVSMLGDTTEEKDKATELTEPEAKVDDGGIVVGGGDPKVDIYLDFICPACGRFQTENDRLLAAAISDKTATLVFHPLNFLDGASDDKYSLRAAAASVCAADDGKFYDYYRTLMQNQPPEGGAGLDDDKLIELGTEIGFADGFGDCVGNGTYLKWIAAETEKAGVSATPTIRIDGQDVETTDFATVFAERTKLRRAVTVRQRFASESTRWGSQGVK